MPEIEHVHDLDWGAIGEALTLPSDRSRMRATVEGFEALLDRPGAPGLLFDRAMRVDSKTILPTFCGAWGCSRRCRSAMVAGALHESGSLDCAFLVLARVPEVIGSPTDPTPSSAIRAKATADVWCMFDSTAASAATRNTLDVLSTFLP